ncbi:hypothetical protein [Planococcus sp. ISL-110]|uniref:hypothetical protein n=1 Tax=Planococcus sp. ISL-110 TaxID=2819167 RepID=UPI001BE92C30|nr:hypothetical protein [Planococcus sp. ISL-110]MBT2569845.1 hypothetical protein [Planococcus sp. ISL-110]
MVRELEPVNELDENRRLSVFELTQSATAMVEALKLEWEREDYYESLCEDIRYYAYRYDDGSGIPGASPATEVQALEILDAKNAYDLRIIKLKEKYSRWRAFLWSIDEGTATTLENYFEKRVELSPEVITKAIQKASRAWEKEENLRARALDYQAKEDYTELCERFPELRRRGMKKFPYLIDGEIVQLTLIDYQMKQRMQRKSYL